MMNKLNILIKIGIIIVGAALIVLIFNFFNLYFLARECPVDINIKPCQAYDNWSMLNKIAPEILLVGIGTVVVGLFKRYQHKF